jgi:hypothetical protein
MLRKRNNNSTERDIMAGVADTAENRQYMQKHRLWLLGEMVTMTLMTERPAAPIPTVIRVLEAECVKPTENIMPPSTQAIADSTEYFQAKQVAQVVEDWLRALMDAKPEVPIEFSLDYFRRLDGQAGGDGVAAPEKAGEEPQADGE